MKIAYIMSRFPLLSETFILREMDEVEKQGGEIALYPIICQDPDVIHQAARAWLPRRHCTPHLSTPIVRATLHTLRQQPGKLLGLFFKTIRHTLSSPNFLLRALLLFPKAVYLSTRFKSESIDHIHAHYATHPAFLAWVIHHLTGISYSITIHSHDIYDRQAMLEPKLLDADFLVTISDFNVDYLVDLFGEWVRAKTSVIHCGIDPHKYQPYTAAPPDSAATGTDEVFQILQIGSLHWKKGQQFLIQAIALLHARDIPVHCRIIGGGPEEKRLQKAIQKYELSGTMELLGELSQDDVASLLPTVDCYVQSSVSEGIPVALMEALACELPVVATNITGVPELVIDQKTGVLVPAKDPQALANAIERVRNDPQKSSIMAAAGRRHVLRKFDLAVNVNQLITKFQEQVC